jgi:hypothetical protein
MAKKKESTPKQVVSDDQKKTLHKWNLWLAALLVVQASAIVVIGGSQTVPLTTTYLATDTLASEAAGHQVLAPATRHLWDMPISWLVVKFLLIFAAVYLVAATVWRGKYEAWLERGVNKLRWVAFGLGGGVVVYAAATLGGVSDLPLLVLTFGLVAAAGASALAAELLGSERRLIKLLCLTASLALLLPLGVLVNKAVGAIWFDGSLPIFVYYLYGSIVLLMVSLGLITHLRLNASRKFADTIYTEKVFMLLGFVLATAVAWQIFAGALV